MNSIYQNAIRAVAEGAKFLVNFQERSFKLAGEYIIKNGQFEGELGVELCDTDKCLEQIEKLYCEYKYSVPSERSESRSKRYFKALMESELTDNAMLYGEHRETAQVSLELYVLCQILNGFKWNESMGSWFWQSKNDKDLVILKCWVEPTSI